MLAGKFRTDPRPRRARSRLTPRDPDVGDPAARLGRRRGARAEGLEPTAGFSVDWSSNKGAAASPLQVSRMVGPPFGTSEPFGFAAWRSGRVPVAGDDPQSPRPAPRDSR